MRSVVMAIDGDIASVLDHNGCFHNIKNDNYEIGQVINVYSLNTSSKPSNIIRFPSIAARAAAVICAVTLFSDGAAYAFPCTTVTLDSDSQIKYSANVFNRVLSVQTDNERVSPIVHELRGKSLNDAIDRTLNELESVDNVHVTVHSKFRKPGPIQNNIEIKLHKREKAMPNDVTLQDPIESHVGPAESDTLKPSSQAPEMKETPIITEDTVENVPEITYPSDVPAPTTVPEYVPDDAPITQPDTQESDPQVIDEPVIDEPPSDVVRPSKPEEPSMPPLEQDIPPQEPIEEPSLEAPSQPQPSPPQRFPEEDADLHMEQPRDIPASPPLEMSQVHAPR